MNQVTHHDFGLFDAELLSVDFISFNINRITSHQITFLASYLQSLGFNSYQKQLDSSQSRQDINNNNSSYNQFEVYFILKIPYQKEIIQLQFPGISGKQFYKLIKHSDGKFSSRGEQKIHEISYSYNESTRQIAGFNKETGDIITAGKYSPRAFDRFLDTKHLGRL